MADYLIENFPDLRFTIPNATYLAWLDFSEYVKSGKIEGSPFDFFLKEAKVAFTDGKPFGEGCENIVRLNFACPRSMLVEGLERVRKAVYKV
jgi:cystathionine beta-lyase